MNLSQPITLDTVKTLPIFKYATALIVCVISLLTILFVATKSYSLYLNSQDFDQKNLEFIEINNQINSTHKRISKLLTKEAQYFNDLSTAPATKSELVDLLSNIGTSRQLIVKKLIASDGVSGQQKEDIIEMELDGSYAGIIEFISRISPLLSASSIESIKLDKRKDSQFIHAALSVKFSKPPLLEVKRPALKAESNIRDSFLRLSEIKNVENMGPNFNSPKIINDELSESRQVVAFRLSGESYYYGAPKGDWRFYNVGFVQQPALKKPALDITQKETPMASVDENSNKREDPFLPSPKLNQGSNSVSAGTFTGTFLSGIVYSESLGLCVVTLPTGESRVFAEGEYINARTKIKSIKPDYVYVQSKTDRSYKVGEEIYAK